jgi:hypothetical protein
MPCARASLAHQRRALLREATIEKIAINYAMASCQPEYFPLWSPRFGPCASQSSTCTGLSGLITTCSRSPSSPAPVVDELEFNTSYGFFGGASRANGTVGRASRLMLVNVGGGHTGNPDRSSSAHLQLLPRREFGAEPVGTAPRPSRSRYRGGSAVTVFASEAPQWVAYGLICPPVHNLWLLSKALSTVT